jgi:uncharacterized protein
MTQTQDVILAGGFGVGPEVQAIALVSQHDFGVRYDLSPETGVISNRQHDLYGEPVRNKILVFANPKGGMAASWALAGLVERGIAPAGIIFRNASPIFVQGAIFAGLPIIHRLRQDPCAEIKTGDLCTLKPTSGQVVLHRDAIE